MEAKIPSNKRRKAKISLAKKNVKMRKFSIPIIAD
jgi:hypothetical protein